MSEIQPRHLGLLLLFPRKPREMTVSEKVAPRKVITEKVMSKDLVDPLNDLGKQVDEIVGRHAYRLEHTPLLFVGKPLTRRKLEIETGLRELEPAYAAYRRGVVDRLGEIQAAVEKFYEEYGNPRRARLRPTLNEEWVGKRFVLRWRWLPWQLPEAVQDQLFTAQEQRQIQDEIARDARKAELRRILGHLEQIDEEVQTGMSALAGGRVVNRRTLRCLSGAMERLSDDLPESEAARLFQTDLEVLDVRVADLISSRESYDRIRDKEVGRGDLEVSLREVNESIFGMLRKFSKEFGELGDEDDDAAVDAAALAAAA